MNDAKRETMHWRKVALWLATLSLLPTAMVIYATLYNDDTPSTAWYVARMVISLTCIGGTLWSFTAAARTFHTDEPRAWAMMSMKGFFVAAMGMCAIAVAQMSLTIIP